MQTENFHGHTIAIGTRAEYRTAVLLALTQATCTRVITINPEYVVLSRNSPLLKGLTHAPALAIPDGIGLAWALAARGRSVERYPGAEMVLDVCAYANEHVLRVGIVIPRNSLSSREAIMQAVYQRYPHLHCTVVVEDESVQQTLQTAKVDVLFVTFGQPRQDTWIAENISSLPSLRLAIGVGGSFDFLTGKRRRAPRLMRQLGVEWLWRLVTQPQRLPRMLRATFGFWYVILTTP